MKRTNGLILIELLLAVALLAVLALAAVPNYLEQQTRSKLSRVRSQQRAMSIALESFYADHKWYPPDGFPWNQGITCPWVTSEIVPTWYKTFPSVYADNINFWRTDYMFFITTPVAYLSADKLTDPFLEKDPSAWWRGSMVWENYQDRNRYYQVQHWPTPIQRVPAIDGIRCPQWVITSIGPDLVKDNVPYNKSNGDPNIIYDPTNGTLSYGSICRAH